ncbi:MAG: ArsC family (seleno)protein [Planctomycetia bacterium]|nr:ArsC family (seleno)protein [Planctomycetia bacterium]
MPAKVDWYYHRKNCQTCTKSQDFMTSNSVAVSETIDARKIRFEPKEAVAFVRQADEAWIARGKTVHKIAFKKEGMADADLLKLIIGPSGFLRAPIIRRGKKIFIGFEPEQFAAFLGVA